jgi:hypothetical protein
MRVHHMLYAGETEEQYLATERLVREVGFDRVNTAAYSPRPNTPAAEWDNQVGLAQHQQAMLTVMRACTAALQMCSYVWSPSAVGCVTLASTSAGAGRLYHRVQHAIFIGWQGQGGS